MHHSGALFRGQGGNGVRDMASPLLGNLGAKFSETSFPHFKTYFAQIGRCCLYTTIFIDSNNFTWSWFFSFQNAWPIKRKAVYS